MVCRVILGVRCFVGCVGLLLLGMMKDGVGGVIIVLIFGCIPLPLIRSVVDTFRAGLMSNFVLADALSGSDFSFCGHSKVKRVVSFADI